MDINRLHPEEVLLRIIMGRTYYAGFLDARGKARAEGAVISATGRARVEVRRYYELNKGDVGLIISRNLLEPSERRKIADYDIDKNISIEDADRCLKLCKELLDELARLR